MSKALEAFLEASEIKAFDADHRKTINFNIAQYDKKVLEGKEQFSNMELARTRAAERNKKAVEMGRVIGAGVAGAFVPDEIRWVAHGSVRRRA